MLPCLGATNKPCPQCKRQSALQSGGDQIKISHHFDLAGYRLGEQEFLLLKSSNISINELTPEVKGICQ
ncbi:hypothetical protein G7083_03870 [Vibrio sp. HDW18]|uniref:hypothetical protein n=1 Tax=Vibrio sp. HDW18 TaxID=2714948 RepID=UPI0014083DE5|nr:hypothetical protein [Vibrio sp. HDW18]QIL85129.1 hypothetical protein G7083_03870 [Vibrio sp. HDW18]